VDYRVALSALSWFSNFAVVKMNEQEAELILANLHTKFETNTQES
jgi:hypothetical protein